jgi:SAM-dependent methyltransferase
MSFARVVSIVERRFDRVLEKIRGRSASGDVTRNLLGGDLDPETLAAIDAVCRRRHGEKYHGRWGVAQLHELAFWRWVAFQGYGGRPPQEFPSHQRKWMLSCFARTGWSLDELNSARIVEIGCGPLGMIEYLPGLDKVGFDPLNDHYQKLFRDVRSGDVRYVTQLESLVADRREGFDLLICFNVLDHTPDPLLILRQAMSLLRPGGRFLVEVNLVRDGWPQTHEHRRMHPSPLRLETVAGWLSSYALEIDKIVSDEPNADNEFFSMFWGSKQLSGERLGSPQSRVA